MKKLIALTAFGLLAFATHASYLYWQVDQANIDKSDDTYTFNGKEVTGFRLTTAIGDPNATKSSYYIDQTPASAGDPVPVSFVGESLYADVGNSGTSISYFIEIVGYDTAKYGAGNVGSLGYAQIATPYLVSDLGSTAELQSAMQAWTGVQAYAVPEPTGAMLMIFGLAMLGLKRRKV